MTLFQMQPLSPTTEYYRVSEKEEYSLGMIPDFLALTDYYAAPWDFYGAIDRVLWSRTSWKQYDKVAKRSLDASHDRKVLASTS